MLLRCFEKCVVIALSRNGLPVVWRWIYIVFEKGKTKPGEKSVISLVVCVTVDTLCSLVKVDRIITYLQTLT